MSKPSETVYSDANFIRDRVSKVIEKTSINTDKLALGEKDANDEPLYENRRFVYTISASQECITPPTNLSTVFDSTDTITPPVLKLGYVAELLLVPEEPEDPQNPPPTPTYPTAPVDVLPTGSDWRWTTSGLEIEDYKEAGAGTSKVTITFTGIGRWAKRLIQNPV